MILYHVTHTEYIASILKKGLLPFQRSNWVNRVGARYGSGEIFAFTDKRDAIRWAARMDWEFNQETGSGKVSIVEFKSPRKEWEIDEADPLSQLGCYGKWLKRLGAIPPEAILRHSPVTTEQIRTIVRR